MVWPKDPKNYTGDNCWICFDNRTRWYKGFRKLCADCIEVLESGDNLAKSLSKISEIKREKRELSLKEQEKTKKRKKRESTIIKRLCFRCGRHSTDLICLHDKLFCEGCARTRSSGIRSGKIRSFKGGMAKCSHCQYIWKIKKSLGSPGKCPRCNKRINF